MSDTKLHYQGLSMPEWEKQINVLLELVNAFIQTNGIDKSSIIINENVLFQIISKVHQRKEYFIFFHKLDMSDFKEMALNCFWIIKLKPISVQQETIVIEKRLDLSFINEKFAIFYLIKKFRSLIDDNEMSQEKLDLFFNEKYVYELLYSFEYRDISKEALILLVETIAKALGFDPYMGNRKSEESNGSD